MASLSADNVAQLVQAATDAAKAASEAVIALKDLQAARTGLNDGFKEASKVIRQPEPFGSEVHEEDLGRWQDFNVNFRAWLFYGNKHFEGDLHRIESVHGDIPTLYLALMEKPQKFRTDAANYIAYSLVCFVENHCACSDKLNAEMDLRFGVSLARCFSPRPRAEPFPFSLHLSMCPTL
jgi:hypothetical protein